MLSRYSRKPQYKVARCLEKNFYPPVVVVCLGYLFVLDTQQIFYKYYVVLFLYIYKSFLLRFLDK